MTKDEPPNPCPSKGSSRFRPFLNASFKSMNGAEMGRGTPRATPHRNPNQIHVIIKSPLSTKLTAHIHNVWSVWVVTQAYYPKKQSLATL